jgi:hypothetical protein
LALLAGTTWPTMEKAAGDAEAERSKRWTDLSAGGLCPADTSVVVFGSLARGEWTHGSDLDWTLFVDGPVAGEHAEVARKIAALVEPGKEPGPTGVFGGLTFRHDLVHFIGGDDDSNTNTTRRILLLLESKSLDPGNVRLRVLRVLLERYVGEDLRYHEADKFQVPRFLANDYARYWRMMTVDSAQKRRDRGDKWALRNVKLRLSRKLIYVTGFWACLSCSLHPPPALVAARASKDRQAVVDATTDVLLEYCERSPLEVLADAFLKSGAAKAGATSFDAYEAFLKILDDPGDRDRLSKLEVADAMSDATFRRAKDAATAFQEGLTTLFFETNTDLTKAAQAYGVF